MVSSKMTWIVKFVIVSVLLCRIVLAEGDDLHDICKSIFSSDEEKEACKSACQEKHGYCMSCGQYWATGVCDLFKRCRCYINWEEFNQYLYWFERIRPVEVLKHKIIGLREGRD
nr:PREDICTED: uncharacterized protein LOC109043114 [Bemisia tabaci]